MYLMKAAKTRTYFAVMHLMIRVGKKNDLIHLLQQKQIDVSLKDAPECLCLGCLRILES